MVGQIGQSNDVIMNSSQKRQVTMDYHGHQHWFLHQRKPAKPLQQNLDLTIVRSCSPAENVNNVKLPSIIPIWYNEPLGRYIGRGIRQKKYEKSTQPDDLEHPANCNLPSRKTEGICCAVLEIGCKKGEMIS